MTKVIDEMAPIVLDAISKAENILLHCHPSPDPDSVGSVLATKFALEQLGKKVTVIQGDSSIPQAFMHFPGAEMIVKKKFGEVDLASFDLFIILDSGSPEMISRLSTPVFPLPIKTVVIDHHASNAKYATINCLEASYPATAQVLFDLFKKWNIELTHDIATNLFMGMYTDTGGFRYRGVTSATLKAASELVEVAPDFTQTISLMENSRTKEALIYNGFALASVKTFFNDTLAIAAVSYQTIKENKIKSEDMSSIPIANILVSVKDFQIGVSMSEDESGKVRARFRSKNSEKFDVSKLALALGGGGHKSASGAQINMPLDEAVKKVVETAKVLYNL